MNAKRRIFPAVFPRAATRWPGAASLAGTVLLAALLLHGWPAPAAQAQPNYFEQRRIEEQAVEAFHRVLTLWREEVYFELYDLGTEASQSRISREAFAQRMVELDWLPAGAPNPNHLDPAFRFRTMVFIKARVPYRSKLDPDVQFSKDQTLLMVKEKGDWRVDLVRLVRAPFA